MEPPWSREDQTRSRTIQPLNRKQAIMFRHGEQIASAPSSNAQSDGRAERPIRLEGDFVGQTVRLRSPTLARRQNFAGRPEL